MTLGLLGASAFTALFITWTPEIMNDSGVGAFSAFYGFTRSAHRFSILSHF